LPSFLLLVAPFIKRWMWDRSSEGQKLDLKMLL
jgi:hypothetical protein